jgi:metallo-beta-lactamase class B
MLRIRIREVAAVVVAGFFLVVHCSPSTASAREQRQSRPPAGEPSLSLAAVGKAKGWNEPAEPMKVVGPIHYVGTKGLSVWLITTAQGHILIQTGMPPSGPMIEASIRKLGLDPTMIEWMLAGHAHVDHVGGVAYLKKLSGARVAMMAQEVELLESGGKTDFHYAEYPPFLFEPVKVDRALRDGETVELGSVVLTARLTPGHTKGSTTFLVDVADAGKTYTVVFPGSTSVNPGYRLTKNPSYPGIADDYRRTLKVLGGFEPDIWLGAHIDPAFDAKRTRAEKEGPSAWVDPEGYAKWVAGERAKLEKLLAAE